MTTPPVTGTPTDATMAVLAAGGAGTPPTGAADFLAAILQALGPGTAGATQAPGTVADPADGATEDAAADASALGLLSPGLVGQLAALAPGAAAGVPAGAGAGAAAGAAAGAVVPAPANVAAGTRGAPTGTTGDIRMSGDAAAAIAGAGPGAPGAAVPAPAIVAAGTRGAPTGTTGDIRMSGDAAAAATPDAAGSSTTVAAAAPLAAPGSAPAAAPPATATPPVGAQVFPEVSSLLTRGDGTHRITLTLTPEALGEVRVVMTVKDGAVHVRLAAGHQAQQALIDGSHELTRLLEHAGAADTRIVVRDLPSGPAPTTGAGADRGADLGQGAGFGAGAGNTRSQDQHAGTRAREHTQHLATDGRHDTTTVGATPPRSAEPVTRVRTSGVDVTM